MDTNTHIHIKNLPAPAPRGSIFLLFLLRQRPWSVACLGGQQAAATSARCDWPIDRSISNATSRSNVGQMRLADRSLHKQCGRHPRYDPWAGPEWLTAPLPHGRRPHHKPASRIQFARRLASALALCWRRMNAAPVEGSVFPSSIRLLYWPQMAPLLDCEGSPLVGVYHANARNLRTIPALLSTRSSAWRVLRTILALPSGRASSWYHVRQRGRWRWNWQPFPSRALWLRHR